MPALSIPARGPVQGAWCASALGWLRKNAGSGVSYSSGGAGASEPTALAALALAGHGYMEEARAAAAWLAGEQLPDGSVGVRPGEPKPAWPTSLALIVWRQLNHDRKFDAPIAKGTDWLLKTKGSASEPSDEVGHDTTLIGWSWAENTHSWLEPTSFALLALTALGKGDHARSKEALKLLENRLLDSGGCNYGNTTVLGSELRPHIQPTGIVLLALAGHGERSPKAAKSMAWLESKLNAASPPSSLAWGLLGLRAQGVVPTDSAAWLGAAAARVVQRDNSPAKRALLTLAATGWPVSETNPGAAK